MLKLLQFVYRKTCHQNNKRGKTIYYSVASFKILEISHFRSENINFTFFEEKRRVCGLTKFCCRTRLPIWWSRTAHVWLTLCWSQTSHQAYEDFNEICFQFLFYTTDQFSEGFAISLPDSQHVRRDVAENDLGGPGGKSINKEKKNTSNNLLKFTASRKKL